jgi:hypothetical protein
MTGKGTSAVPFGFQLQIVTQTGAVFALIGKMRKVLIIRFREIPDLAECRSRGEVNDQLRSIGMKRFQEYFITSLASLLKHI